MNIKATPAALHALATGDVGNFVAASRPGGIEAQEAAGQAALVNNSMLPREMLYGCTREKLAQMGITLGARHGSGLFVEAQLPEGWKKQATSHSMWSDLLDEKGRRRASIFYKAAFYDQSAHISLCKRFAVELEPCDEDGNPIGRGEYSHLRTVVKDGDSTIHVVGICKARDFDTSDDHSRLAKAWLDEHYPDWQDPMAYWDVMVTDQEVPHA